MTNRTKIFNWVILAVSFSLIFISCSSSNFLRDKRGYNHNSIGIPSVFLIKEKSVSSLGDTLVKTYFIDTSINVSSYEVRAKFRSQSIDFYNIKYDIKDTIFCGNYDSNMYTKILRKGIYWVEKRTYPNMVSAYDTYYFSIVKKDNEYLIYLNDGHYYYYLYQGYFIMLPANDVHYDDGWNVFNNEGVIVKTKQSEINIATISQEQFDESLTVLNQKESLDWINKELSKINEEG